MRTGTKEQSNKNNNTTQRREKEEGINDQEERASRNASDMSAALIPNVPWCSDTNHAFVLFVLFFVSFCQKNLVAKIDEATGMVVSVHSSKPKR